MSIDLVSIVWGCLQIGGLCGVSLSIAWLLGGRRPQVVTAMLAGTCLATLLLAVVALMPACQWTVVTAERGMAGATTLEMDTTPAAAADHATGVVDTDQSTSVSNMDQLVSSGSLSFHAAEANRFPSIHELLSRALERVDYEVRMAEEWQQPIAAARNYSLGSLVLVGLGAMSLLWCSSWLYIHRILKASRTIDDANILNLVATHSRAFGLKRTPGVRESNQVPIGATVGWTHVAVLLHADWRTWTDQERSAVIAHELAHAARHDFVWVVVASWTRILLFFHPLVHLLIHRWRMEQELAADQLAAGKVGNAKAYGRALASLALRNQLSLGTSNSHVGSMLAAGQICVTRRVMMLRQGSLKPVQSRSRWSLAIVFAIACSAGPIAGLRGTAQEPSGEAAATAVTTTTPTTSVARDEVAAPQMFKAFKPLSKEFLEAFPPLEFTGSLVYRPGRLRAGEFGAVVAWVQEFYTSSLLGSPMPDTAIVHGECPFRLRWLDEERQHGALDISASFREGESTIAGQLEKLSKFRGLFKAMRVVTSQSFEGRTISGVCHSASGEDPEQWLVDDDAGYFLGSLEDAKKFIQGQRFAVAAIPETFRDDYLNATFAIVFSDCEQWHDKLQSYTQGSAKEATFQLVLQLIKDVRQVGLFVDGCQSPACTIRAEMLDENAATRLADQATALVAMAKLAKLAKVPTDAESAVETELRSSFLETLTITNHSTEVHFQFDVFSPSLDNGSSLADIRSIAGWQNIACFPTLHDSDTPYVEIAGASIDNGVETLPSLFSQTLDARNYRGKTVSVEMELQCHEESLGEAGLFVWASRHEAVTPVITDGRQPLCSQSPYVGHRMLAAKTVACDGVSPFRTVGLPHEVQHAYTALPVDAEWRKLTVQMVVPHAAEHLSFGCYSGRGVIRMRQAKLRIIAPNESSELTEPNGQDALESMPYNLLVFPGYEVRTEPLNLGLTEIAPEPQRQASRAEATAR